MLGGMKGRREARLKAPARGPGFGRSPIRRDRASSRAKQSARSGPSMCRTGIAHQFNGGAFSSSPIEGRLHKRHCFVSPKRKTPKKERRSSDGLQARQADVPTPAVPGTLPPIPVVLRSEGSAVERIRTASKLHPTYGRRRPLASFLVLLPAGNSATDCVVIWLLVVNPRGLMA